MPMPRRFKNRTHAGELLAQNLAGYARRPDVIVLALPRGGVRVGFAIAQKLHVALDVLLVRKLGLPGQDDETLGAVTSGGIRILHGEAPGESRVPEKMLGKVAQRELQEIARREALYRGGRPALRLQEHVVILTDDGLTNSSAMFAAVEAVRREKPARLIVAVPLGTAEACGKLQPAVDEFVCLSTPDPVYAIGMWYKSFSQTTDEEVRRMLAEAERQHAQRTIF